MAVQYHTYIKKVLASGKSIHQNIAQQFKNSVVIADQEKEKDVDGDKFIKHKRSRSKSISKTKLSKKHLKIEEKKESNDINADKKINQQNNNLNGIY